MHQTSRTVVKNVSCLTWIWPFKVAQGEFWQITLRKLFWIETPSMRSQHIVILCNRTSSSCLKLQNWDGNQSHILFNVKLHHCQRISSMYTYTIERIFSSLKTPDRSDFWVENDAELFGMTFKNSMEKHQLTQLGKKSGVWKGYNFGFWKVNDFSSLSRCEK